FNTVSKVGRASSGKWSWRVRIGSLFHTKYYKNAQIWHLTSCDYPLIGTKPFRLKFPRSCLRISQLQNWFHDARRFSAMPMLSHLHDLFSAEQCQAYIRTLRWKDRPRQCPRCQSHHIGQWGTYQYRPGCKRYWCHSCKRTFNDLTQ